MKDIYLATAVMDRAKLPDLAAVMQKHKAEIGYVALGHGTAKGVMLENFGLESSEKAVCLSVMTGSVWKAVKRDLQRVVRIDVPGTGIAFTVPLSSFGGKRELACLTQEQNLDMNKELEMQNTDHELLVVICDQGYNEMVMDAAREAGAPGGTVIHAKGTGNKAAEKFLGISLASEKDIIFLVVRTEDRNSIMQQIMKQAGIDTKAKAIVFSLPVTETAGLRLLENSED